MPLYIVDRTGLAVPRGDYGEDGAIVQRAATQCRTIIYRRRRVAEGALVKLIVN